MNAFTQLQLFIMEIKAYDEKWYNEIGGIEAAAELARLTSENKLMQKSLEEYAEHMKEYEAAIQRQKLKLAAALKGETK